MKMPDDSWCGCPIRFSAAEIGDRWKLLILRDLAFKKASRFRDFAREEGISTNILTRKLGELAKAGIIEIEIDDGRPNRPSYRLTAKGRGLIPALIELIEWAAKWDAATEVTPQAIAHLRKTWARLS
ncbi:winged helix-turn-helix transcriptional regulator [Mesorhizobium sp. ZMM04-5]|uniref:Winged helix-turn-helix transcriptional regulator n=1 Tax=Mesorhizobium marinum TaxID=3228790 RepID=A0ABV3R5S7_9HYPH